MSFFKSNNVVRKFFITPVIISLFFLLIPQKTQAQYIDIAQSVKEFGLDTVAYSAAQIILKKLTATTVNWINSGFKGNPAYVTDPKQFFLDAGDDVASRILSDTQLNQICSPFKAQVRLALVKNYISENENFTCTLSKVKNNFEEFTNDFSKGGWDGWFEVTQNSGNNPFGVYLNAQGQLLKKVDTKINSIKDELVQGNGLLSLKRCPESKTVTQAKITFYDNMPASQNPYNGKKVGDCMGELETVTPGTVINNQLSKALGSKWDKLGAADEISEIMSALVTQLVEQAVGAASGLRGASEKSPNGGPSVADRTRDEAEPKAKVDPNQIKAQQGSIKCYSSSSSEAANENPDGTAVSSNSSNCESTETIITGLPTFNSDGSVGSGPIEEIGPCVITGSLDVGQLQAFFASVVATNHFTIYTPARLGAMESELGGKGITLQKNSAGEVRGRLYLPSKEPFTCPVDVFNNFAWDQKF